MYYNSANNHNILLLEVAIVVLFHGMESDKLNIFFLSGSISSQVISEFAVSAEKKMKMDPVEILQAIHLFSGFSCSDISFNLTVAAWKRHIKSVLSYRDSLIIEAALSEQCSILYSEDMNHGQVYDGLTVMNPFLH